MAWPPSRPPRATAGAGPGVTIERCRSASRSRDSNRSVNCRSPGRPGDDAEGDVPAARMTRPYSAVAWPRSSVSRRPARAGDPRGEPSGMGYGVDEHVDLPGRATVWSRGRQGRAVQRLSEPSDPASSGTTVSSTNAGSVVSTRGKSRVTGRRRAASSACRRRRARALDRHPVERGAERGAVAVVVRPGRRPVVATGATAWSATSRERAGSGAAPAGCAAAARRGRAPSGPPGRSPMAAQRGATGRPAAVVSAQQVDDVGQLVDERRLVAAPVRPGEQRGQRQRTGERHGRRGPGPRAAGQPGQPTHRCAVGTVGRRAVGVERWRRPVCEGGAVTRPEAVGQRR